MPRDSGDVPFLSRFTNLSGRAISSTDAKGNISTAEYDTAGRTIKAVTPMTESINTVSKTYYDNAQNPVKQSVQSNKIGETEDFRTVEYTYDNMGNVIASKQNDGVSDSVTMYSYDNANRLTDMYTGLSAITQNPENPAISYSYNEHGFNDKITDALNQDA